MTIEEFLEFIEEYYKLFPELENRTIDYEEIDKYFLDCKLSEIGEF